MRRRPYANAAPDESTSLLIAALVLTLFGVLAAVAGVGGLVLRYAKKN